MDKGKQKSTKPVNRKKTVRNKQTGLSRPQRLSEELKKVNHELYLNYERLQESEKKYRKLSHEFDALLNAIPDPLMLLSPEMKILWANTSVAAVFGREIPEITGEHCYKLWRDASSPCNNCPAVKSFNTGEAESGQSTTADARVWSVRTFPIKDDEKVTNVIVLTTDITEKITFQAETIRASHLVSLGELAAGVAHEINNPINGIINYAQMLANRSDKSSEEYDIANRIIKEGNRVDSIVRGLLFFAREQKVEKSPVHVHEMLSDALALTETMIKKDGINLMVDLPQYLPAIIANQQQIQQVFLNVINNAHYALNRKFGGMHEGKVLKISGETIISNGKQYVQITFYDSGTGIPADAMGKIMNPFFSTKPRGKGTGLGLSISHGIIKNHGGMLIVNSGEGEFTEVIICLPAREYDEP